MKLHAAMRLAQRGYRLGALGHLVLASLVAPASSLDLLVAAAYLERLVISSLFLVLRFYKLFSYILVCSIYPILGPLLIKLKLS